MAKVLISANSAWNIANFRAGLIRSLQAAGHIVVAAAPADGETERLKALGCCFIPLPMDNQGTSPARDMALLARYRRLLKAERPEVFLSYTIKPNIYGTLAARSLGIPSINNVSGLGTAFIRDGWLTTVVKRLYGAALAGSSTVFFQNTEDRDLFLANGLVQTAQAEVLPGSGIDLTQFAATPMPDGEDVIFLMIARLLWDKGVGEYVEAARLLKARVPAAQCRILGFLDVPNRTAVARADVERWVEEGIITYQGATDDVRPFIEAAHCVVLPSYREGTPRTLLEAAAMARPLIATDVPGCREPVREGVNGHLCTVRDGADLADKMAAFCAAPPAARAAMGRASRALAEEHYAEEIVVEAYRQAISRALGAAALRGATLSAARVWKGERWRV